MIYEATVQSEIQGYVDNFGNEAVRELHKLRDEENERSEKK